MAGEAFSEEEDNFQLIEEEVKSYQGKNMFVEKLEGR